ncbi:MAG: tRNA lysidine(34) synthetase TilS [Pseudomonadota bacterium]
MSKRRVSIQTAVRRHVPASARVLVAVSGGRDSAVLLHAILGAQRLLNLHVEVCHVDHGLRPSSKDDAAFVSEWCSRVGIACHVRRLGVVPKQVNIEAWARRERYAAFAEIQAERHLTTLLTAHTANDVAETLLIRLIARKELTSIEESDSRRGVIRPLLEIDRKQIDEYVVKYSVPYVDDPTNAETIFVRNRVRHELLPLLAQRFDRSIVWILAEQARSLAQDSEALRSEAAKVVDAIGELKESDSAWLARCQSQLSMVAPAIQWRVVQALCVPRLGFSVGESKAIAMLKVVCGEESAIDLGQGVRLERDSRGVRFSPGE